MRNILLYVRVSEFKLVLIFIKSGGYWLPSLFFCGADWQRGVICRSLKGAMSNFCYGVLPIQQKHKQFLRPVCA
jgi:hypothetical protein